MQVCGIFRMISNTVVGKPIGIENLKTTELILLIFLNRSWWQKMGNIHFAHWRSHMWSHGTHMHRCPCYTHTHTDTQTKKPRYLSQIRAKGIHTNHNHSQWRHMEFLWVHECDSLVICSRHFSPWSLALTIFSHSPLQKCFLSSFWRGCDVDVSFRAENHS